MFCASLFRSPDPHDRKVSSTRSFVAARAPQSFRSYRYGLCQNSLSPSKPHEGLKTSHLWSCHENSGLLGMLWVALQSLILSSVFALGAQSLLWDCFAAFLNLGLSDLCASSTPRLVSTWSPALLGDLPRVFFAIWHLTAKSRGLSLIDSCSWLSLWLLRQRHIALAWVRPSFCASQSASFPSFLDLTLWR